MFIFITRCQAMNLTVLILYHMAQFIHRLIVRDENEQLITVFSLCIMDLGLICAFVCSGWELYLSEVDKKETFHIMPCKKCGLRQTVPGSNHSRPRREQAWYGHSKMPETTSRMTIAGPIAIHSAFAKSARFAATDLRIHHKSDQLRASSEFGYRLRRSSHGPLEPSEKGGQDACSVILRHECGE